MQSVPKIVRDRLQAVPPETNHPDADLLTAFAEQSLPAVERASVLDHLARCRDCREVVALALPPTEVLETAARPVRSAWLTWPVLRWGFVAAGVVIVASLGVLQVRKHSTSSDLAKFGGPSSQVARQEARPQLTAAPPSTPAAKPDTATFDRMDEVSKETGVAIEGKTPTPVAPPASPLIHPFRATTNSTFGRSVGGPRLPSQLQSNNNVQQQVSNALPAPALNLPADQLSSAKQSAGASEAVAGAAAPTSDTEGARLEAKLRDQSSDSELFAEKSGVSKTKLPVSQPAPGLIAGHVVDSSGAVVPNARITVTPSTTGKSASAVTDSQGAFLIVGVAPGNYKAQAQAPGFNTSVMDLNYDASRPSTYNFTLNVGSVSETVEISAQNAQVQTESATMGGPVTNSMVSRVPTNGRNYGELTSNSPGQPPRWTVSASGALQRSFDQGKSWQTVDVNASPTHAASLEFARESPARDVSKEKEADKKALKAEGEKLIFRAVSAAGAEVWAGGSAGALYHSLDAGNHWTRVVPASNGAILTADIVRLEFSDSKNGRVTTSAPEVWTTSDAGQTWQKQ